MMKTEIKIGLDKGKRDNKKLAGQLIILVSLIFFIAYPSLNNQYWQYRISSLMETGEYSKAYELLQRKEIEPLSKEFINLMICEIMLAKDVDLTPRVNLLLLNKRRDLIQDLVNNYGPKLGHHLNRFYEIGEIDFCQETLNVLVYQYLQRSNLSKAMEVRGDKETYDFLAMQYDLSKGNVQLAMDNYYEIPQKYQEKYSDIIVSNLLNIDKLDRFIFPILDWQWEGYSELDELINEITTLDFPEDVLRSFVARLNILKKNRYTPYGRWEENVSRELNKFFRHPKFTNQDYFDYFDTIASLNSYMTREKAAEEIIYNENFTHFPTRTSIANSLSSKTVLTNDYYISRDGIMLFNEYEWTLWYWEHRITKRYDLVNNRYLEDLEKMYHFISISPDRTYFAVTAYNESEFESERLFILGSHFQQMIDFNATGLYNGTSHWVDRQTITFLDANSRRLSYTPTTGAITQGIAREIRDPMIAKRYDQESGVWSVGDETYSVIEKRVDYDFFVENPVYVVRCSKTNSSLAEVAIDATFEAACDRYVYQLEKVEWGFSILTATCKETQIKRELPFYIFR